MQRLYEKPPGETLKLHHELLQRALRAAKSLRKDFTWFRYARWSRRGCFVPLTNRQVQLGTLNRIFIQTVKAHPEFTTGEIADMLSELVNTS